MGPSPQLPLSFLRALFMVGPADLLSLLGRVVLAVLGSVATGQQL